MQIYLTAGKDIRQMMEQYDVNISIPPSAQSSNVVKISGVDNKVQNAISALEERVKELEKEREDRVSSIVIYILVVTGDERCIKIDDSNKNLETEVVLLLLELIMMVYFVILKILVISHRTFSISL